ncbi:SpoIIE family protein phosphatase [Actinacidiphila guanduensis]|uniref:protein-serine/threonine phosphatase n=1 Tax=Actinacidiphila guanduensis TaxID=310781 RepID=A0A1G9VAI5_9ACTN|nr:SpoIIE family protein phosphatase [Actinacidiphila guanduensis]SDM69100.1 PAS domain S-box-containing protein [Actinacidiphila guanduensis]
MAHNSTPATAVLDGAGTIRGWTAPAQDALGYRAQDVLGRPVADLLPERTAAAQVAGLRAHNRTGEPWTARTQLRRKDGSGVVMDVQAWPLDGAGDDTWLLTAADRSGLTAWPPAGSTVSAALLARSPVGLTLWDTDLRCIWANAAAERQDGVLRRHRIGRLMSEVQPGANGRAITAAMRQVLETGEPVIEREYTWRVPGEDQDRILSASYFRLDGPDGRPLGLCNMATDIETSLARQHLLTLGQVGNRIGTTLDVIRTAQELADAAVPLLADYVTVDLAESVPLGEEPLQRLPSTPGAIPVFRRAGLASVHEGMPEALWKVGEPVFVPPSSPFTHALFSGRTHYEPVLDTSPGTWLDQDPDRARVIAETGMHSLVVVPLKARGTVLGVAVFIRSDTRLPFSRDDVLLIEELTGRAALSLDNARRYTRERASAVALQRNLLPRNLSGGKAVDVASRYLPAHTHEGVGGDWFDVIHLPGHRVGLAVGDVVGHGINAAALMGQLRTVMGTLADLDLPPHDLLARLDRRVLLMGDQDDAEPPGGPVMSCTCVYAVYDPVTRRCTMASAGHPPPAVLTPDGTVSFADLPSGPPIGLGTMSYESVTMELPEGTVIALYTDGLVETRKDDIDVGLERLRRAMARTGTSLDDLCTHIIGAMAPNVAHRPQRPPGSRLPILRPEDDIALLLARTRVLGAEEAATRNALRLPTP